MKLVHTNLNTAVLSDKYVFTEWIIESPKLYAYYLQELFLQQNGEEGRFVLSDKEKELNIAKNMEIIVNPFQIEINGRKILNKLYAELDQLSKSELMYYLTDLQMQELIKEISYQDVKGLFIENHERSCMEGGMRYIIDRDGCEIY